MQRYHHGKLREALLAAGWELLGERGADALSLREVARRAGVSHAAPYRHFEDRAALLRALAEHGFSLFERRLGACASPAALARAYVSFAREQPARFRLMFDGDNASASVRAALARTLEPLGGSALAWAQLHGIAVLAAEGLLDECVDAEALAAEAVTRLRS